jgi:hypothetical protein
MRRIVPVIMAVGMAGLFAADASAAKIFGDLKIDGKPVAEGIKLRVTHPGVATIADSTTTDKFGSFKLLVKEEGKALLTVVYEKTTLELPVFSNKEATRYDLILEKKDGKLTLRRK